MSIMEERKDDERNTYRNGETWLVTMGISDWAVREKHYIKGRGDNERDDKGNHETGSAGDAGRGRKV